ncbi:MAG: ribose-phosphate pyrophosphokinase [Oscillospiraceae bacterium]|nr:ribose-phosphate pyrophosphokinase [Oscillospiraceae bacterium]MDY2847177.1 ribose-phosphate pyrophosphokinase [Oscillospiraceae bacterium]
MNVHGKDIKIFSANSNPEVAKQIAESLGLPLGQSEVVRFSDGEISVSIQESVRGSDVFVVQSTSTPVNDNLMELLIMIDAFKRASAGRITAVIPYMGYARQDRKAKARDPISAKLCADIITAAGADRVLTMDLHCPQIQGFFNIPVDHLLGVPILAPYFIEKFKGCKDDCMIVSPDLGSVTRARNFAQKFGAPFAIVDKRRQRANVCEVMNIIGDVKDKKVILVDDMIDTAGTLCNAAKAIIEIGGASEVYACATHGVLSGPAIERIQNSVIKELVILDTIALPDEKRIDKIKTLPVAPVFAQAIQRIYMDASISPLFNK